MEMLGVSRPKNDDSRGGWNVAGQLPSACCTWPGAGTVTRSVLPGLTQKSAPPAASGASKYAAPAGRAYGLYATSTRSVPKNVFTRTPTPGVQRIAPNPRLAPAPPRVHPPPAAADAADSRGAGR